MLDQTRQSAFTESVELEADSQHAEAVWGLSLSKHIAQRKLNKAGIKGLEHAAEVHRADVAHRVPKLCLIEEIEKLGAELQALTFSDFRPLERRKLPIHESGAPQDVASEVSVTPRSQLVNRRRADAAEMRVGSGGGRAAAAAVEPRIRPARNGICRAGVVKGDFAPNVIGCSHEEDAAEAAVFALKHVECGAAA